MSDNPEWFAAKRYGFGSGFPIAWQGWVIMLAFGAIMRLVFALFAHKSRRLRRIVFRCRSYSP